MHCSSDAVALTLQQQAIGWDGMEWLMLSELTVHAAHVAYSSRRSGRRNSRCTAVLAETSVPGLKYLSHHGMMHAVHAHMTAAA